jgi:integrase/recombinase XerD
MARLCMPLEQWPQKDKLRYREALQPTTFLARPQPARNWSPKRRRIVEQGYGQWLAFLDANGWLDTDAEPGARATPERVQLFLLGLQGRVSSWSVTMMFQGFVSMVAVMTPASDFGWLKKIVGRLKRAARPERDKRPHMVGPGDLLALGMALMDHAAAMGNRYHAASCMRDGFMIALLASIPVRIGNFSTIVIGRHLAFDGRTYRLEFSAEETKMGIPVEAELSTALRQSLDTYLRDHRRRLLARGTFEDSGHLWINRWGKRMDESAIRTQIEKRTRAAFGRHVWPHLFRSIAATGVVDHSPELVGMVPDLLGHADAHTAHRYYILADAGRAHAAVHASFEAQRMEAFARWKRGRSRR